jgi:threonine aldolase
MEFVDLRSDTVTKPTPAMREAMATAEVGDDVFGEDPTVNRLQEMAAERMGKEAALFVPTGTMGNLLAVLTHCGRGDEAIMGNQAHTFLAEAGGIAALGGVHTYTVPNQPDGSLRLEDLQEALRSPNNPHHPLSRLLVVENTQNRCGGCALPVEFMQQMGNFAHTNGLLFHMDGARVFNAAAALGVKVNQLTEPVDSVTFCLSKGLCAPVGSVLCGSKDFIRRSVRIRKQLGAGMRQVGVIAAAGIVALEQMVDRLPEDHHRAKVLAAGLKDLPGLHLDWEVPQSNMVFITLDATAPYDAAQLAKRLLEDKIKVNVAGSRRIRLVTHYWIDDENIGRAVQAFHRAL